MGRRRPSSDAGCPTLVSNFESLSRGYREASFSPFDFLAETISPGGATGHLPIDSLHTILLYYLLEAAGKEQIVLGSTLSNESKSLLTWEEIMQVMKWLGCAAVGATMFFAGSSAFAVTIGFSQVGDEGDWRPAWSKAMQEEAKNPIRQARSNRGGSRSWDV